MTFYAVIFDEASEFYYEIDDVLETLCGNDFDVDGVHVKDFYDVNETETYCAIWSET